MPQANSVIILPSYVEAVDELPAKERGEMWRAIIEYAAHGRRPDLKTTGQRAIFAAIKPSMDYNADRRRRRARQDGGLSLDDLRRTIGLPMVDDSQAVGRPSAGTASEETGKEKVETGNTPPYPPAGAEAERDDMPETAADPLQQAPEKPVKAWFDRLWAIYPKKQACYPAQAALAAMAWELTEADVDRMEAMIRTNAASAEWTKEGGRYVPRMDRWLASKPWLDGDPGAAQQAQTHRLSPQERAAIDELMGGETA